MSCDNACYETDVNACDDMLLKVGLVPFTNYILLLNKVFSDHVYERKYTTDGNGVIQILKSDFPVGYFNAYAGQFKIRVKLASDYSTVPMEIGTATYDCIQVNLKAIDAATDDTSPINIIQ